MNLKELVAGGLITLSVTVVGGIGVWWGTEYFSKQKGELIVFNTDYSTSFKSGDSELGTATLYLLNSGDQTAEDINAEVVFAADVKIEDRSYEASSGDLVDVINRPDDQALNKASISIRSLNPSESVKFSFLLKGSGYFEPRANVRTSKTVGRREIVQQSALDPFKWITFAAGALAAPLGILVALLFRRSLSGWPTAADHNNSAFVLLQKREVDLAERILMSAADRRGFGFHSLNNFALIIGLKGERERANGLFSASEWWAGKNRFQKSLVQLNKAILCFANKDTTEGKALLAEAIRLSPDTTKSFCIENDYIVEASGHDPEVKVMLDAIKAKASLLRLHERLS